MVDEIGIKYQKYFWSNIISKEQQSSAERDG